MTTATKQLIPQGTWTADPGHSQVGFSVKHMGIATVRGDFSDFDGSLEVGDDLSEAKINATVKVATVDTGEEARDEHLRSEDFFAAGEYPEMTFVSRSISSDGDDIKVVGDLTIRGETREIVLDGEVAGIDEDPWGNERVGIELTGVLPRADYGMKFNQALGSGNMLVGDKVKLAIDISAIKQ